MARSRSRHITMSKQRHAVCTLFIEEERWAGDGNGLKTGYAIRTNVGVKLWGAGVVDARLDFEVVEFDAPELEDRKS